MKAHKIEMVYVWARENGIRGYDHLDPTSIAKRRQEALNDYNKSKFEKPNKQQYNNR